jgi:hypothetical protein
MVKRRSVKKISSKNVRKPVFQLSQAFIGGGMNNYNPASVSDMGAGGAAGYELGKVGTLSNQWNTVMDIGSKTYGNSFDMPASNSVPTPQQLALAQSGGSRRRRRRGTRRGKRFFGLFGGQVNPLVHPIAGGARRTRRRKHRRYH